MFSAIVKYVPSVISITIGFVEKRIMKSDHFEPTSEEGLRWNPYSQTYDKMCQCGSGCLDFLIGKSFYEKFRISDKVFCDCQMCPFCNKYHDWSCAEEEDEEKRIMF